VTSISDMLENPPRKEPVRKSPPGWEPGYSYDTESGTGEVTTGPLPVEPDAGVWAELIRDWGLDPARQQIVPGSVQVRGWDANVGGGQIERLRYYRARIVDRTVQTADVDELVRIAGKRKPLTPRKPATDTLEADFVVSMNDWQIGKAGPDGSSEETVDGLTDAFAAARTRLRAIERTEGRPERVVLANTGDLIEGITGHYASQERTVDLGLRDQMRIARRLIFGLIDDFTRDGYPVLVTAVACNHGEVRGGGNRSITTPDDNLSLAIIEGVDEACSANPDRYEGVEFAYARDGLTLVIEASGVNVGMTHGHQMRGSANAAGTAVAAKWWEGQIMGTQPIANADMLMTAHRHYLEVSEMTGRTIIQAPAFDGGSFWYTSATGRNSPRGLLTLTVGRAHERGWGNLDVH